MCLRERGDRKNEEIKKLPTTQKKICHHFALLPLAPMQELRHSYRVVYQNKDALVFIFLSLAVAFFGEVFLRWLKQVKMEEEEEDRQHHTYTHNTHTSKHTHVHRYRTQEKSAR
jgi:hypothetical protein